MTKCSAARGGAACGCGWGCGARGRGGSGQGDAPRCGSGEAESSLALRHAPLGHGPEEATLPRQAQVTGAIRTIGQECSKEWDPGEFG